jgi:hypothetical protein
LAGRGIGPFILNFSTGWMWVVSLTIQQYFLQGKSPQHPSNRVWVGYSTGLDALEWRKIFCPCWEWNYNSLVIHPTAGYTNGLVVLYWRLILRVGEVPTWAYCHNLQ